MAPVAQLALDFVNIEQALRVAHEAAAAGPLWLEAGTPLIKAEGLEAVRRLRAAFPDATIVADMKVMDAGRVEVEFARKAGADIVSVLAASTDATLAECVEAARRVGCAVLADLVAVPDPVARAKEVERLGVDLIGVHLPIDRQMQGAGDEVFSILTAVAHAVTVPVACAGGITPATAARAVAAGARIVIVGGAVTKVPDARGAAAQLLAALAGAAAPTAGAGFRRVGLGEVRSVLAAVSTPNLCDAMHGQGALRGFIDRNPGRRLCGPARTVLCPAGDWSKPVQTIDACQPGEVLVIDAGDGVPALWGGLATRTAAQRQLGGVVIRGACRDLADIRALPLPLWASRDCPDAGVPRGAGSLDVPLALGAVTVQPGDWIVGDEDGLVRIAAREVVAVANRARDIMEREQRLAAEIDSGRTLAQIAELKKWEQR
jgi:3-hexulose-6-phosphate synthase/6-phospho-3-hexuloisomerase